ncbi:unnamed protein product [Ceutorhynchus assimilis]|uniref:Uncharacterized protein n=1 Tax=Ceutorhynchus assimilis TaxID=467358 RepID=A0A9N9QNF8_9CUCU|nr:unnamed protein product [Ceutorhynchus assimilis]
MTNMRGRSLEKFEKYEFVHFTKNHPTLSIILLLVIFFATLVPGKVINCRPLPQCCRRYIFSPACRGVAAKRSEMALKGINQALMRDPRMEFPALDPDYDENGDFGALIDDEVDFQALNRIKSSTNVHVE